MARRWIFRADAKSFWGYHDWVYEHQAELKPENLREKVIEFATAKKLETLALSRCIDTKATEAEVNKNVADARALQIESTPTLFLNGRRLVGQISWPQLRQIIDHEIEYQKTAKNAGENCGCEVKLPTPFNN